jgi:hypothetical protein
VEDEEKDEDDLIEGEIFGIDFLCNRFNISWLFSTFYDFSVGSCLTCWFMLVRLIFFVWPA